MTSLRAGHILQLLVVALLGLAVVMVQSAGMSVGQDQITLSALLLNRTTLYAGLAIAAMLLASRIDLQRLANIRGWSNPIYWILGLSMTLVVAAMIPGIGVTINGAHRWLRLGPASLGVTFQPSELVKWALVLAVALWCAGHVGKMDRFFTGLLPALAMIGLACVLIVKEDLGTAALVGLVSLGMLVAGGAKLWHLAIMIPPALAGAGLAIASSPYRRARLTSFMDPWADARGAGYQAIQSLVAIAGAGAAGRGLGNGIQKFGYVPADTTDFIFAIICEELGLAGAALVIGIYLAFIWVGLDIVRRCTDPFARLVALGVIMTVGIQALINIAVVTVVVPTKGIALPLLSSGGTGWIVTALAIGLLAGIDRRQTQLFAEQTLQPAPAVTT